MKTQNNWKRAVLATLGGHDQYSETMDLFVLDGEVVTTPAHAVGFLKARHGMHSMEAKMHLSSLVRNGARPASRG